MAVLINFKICDNAKECNGIAVCPTGALSWNEKKKSIAIDNSLCNSCGACEKACMVDAIRVARNGADYKKMENEMRNDTRKISDLFIDRYGAQPIHHAFLIGEEKFGVEVLESGKLVAAEIFSNDSIMCLLYSIPIKELFQGTDIKYRKVEVKDKSLLRKYGVKKMPALLFFRDGKLLGKVEGHYRARDGEKLKKKIGEVLGKPAAKS